MERHRSGVQTEVLFSLALVMVLATVVLTTVLIANQERLLRDLLGRSLLGEARSEPAGRALTGSLVPGTHWWWVSETGRVEERTPGAGSIDPRSIELAARARAEGAPLLQPGAVWEEIRFAAPVEGGRRIAVGRLPREASARLRLHPLGVVGLVLGVDVLVFGALGATLLRRRVIGPLQRLAAGARAVAEGARETRVAEEGSREAAEVARAFNEMTDALEGRSADLEKAVVDLRAANEELRRTRAGLDRAERLASVGQLAAGVAHEIGNPIGAILALLDLAGRDPALGEASRRHLERAGREGERVRVILRQLLDFSRPRRSEPEAVDLLGVAREVVGLVGAQRRYRSVAFDVEGEAPGAAAGEGALPPVRADRGVVTQILLNLVLNAADAALAANEAPGVGLRVRGTALQRRAGDASPAPARSRGPDALECVVSDNGGGIPEELEERIFDPFFTTKPPGEGTGLGLANAVRLAEDMEGDVERVEPPTGHRTAFALRLPVHREPAGDETRARVR